MTIEELKGKNIVLIGLGTEGISTAKYLLKNQISFSILDENDGLKIPEEILPGVKETHLGANYLVTLNKFEVIFRSPGIRISLPLLQQALKNGQLITSQTKFFFENCPASIIGVTGTKGKGTTSALIYEILKKAGKTVFLGGNIGAPMLDFLDETKPADWVVLELSSFQLVDLHLSPKVAVVLMTTVDHLDYHLTEGAYWQAKSSIVSHQTATDFAVLNHESNVAMSFAHKTNGKLIYFSKNKKVSPGAYVQEGKIMTDIQGEILTLMKVEEVSLLGEHNLDNVCAAVTVGKILGIDNPVIKMVVMGFKGLPHRLEFCGEVDGVKFFDDSASTNPETAIAAIKSFTKPEVFILGGSSKGADFSKLGQEIAFNSNVVGIILIGEEGPKIAQAIKSNGTFTGFILTSLKDLNEAVRRAKKLTPHGGVVVLSPACASFDMFKNYAQRGEEFKSLVKLLEKETEN